MAGIVKLLWLIPAAPLAAAAAGAVLRQRQKRLAASLAVGAMAIALLLSVLALLEALAHSGQGQPMREVFNFRWFQTGDAWVELGWVLDPLAATMLVMVSLVGLLIFIFSLGYMAHDENFTRFFCFLSLFAAAMFGVVIANSLLLFFIAWELVGLTSYLLIGFWYQKPAAAAAAKKAFITTRIGDLGLFLGMVWLYGRTGTLVFYDAGNGCLEQGGLVRFVAPVAAGGLGVTTAIGLLLFCGAVGKSGQLPLHVWLPDAMEGPTPVSALIHAATMVAAGVFLVARVYPLLAVHGSAVLPVVTWVGALTALFAATIAVAQTDLKRILAYSTVSQLGFMMLGLGVGGIAVGMFHLVTHACFKALLFLGAGSVIHGCHEEQDIRRLGGLRKFMPVTFATYAVGMLALSGFPLLAGFWSKDEILHAALGWSRSRAPFYLAVLGALLTAFYMTRQVCYVFFGRCRLTPRAAGVPPADRAAEPGSSAAPLTRSRAVGVPTGRRVQGSPRSPEVGPRESPAVMRVPLLVLSFFALALGFTGTPAWRWFQAWLEGQPVAFTPGWLLDPGTLGLMALSGLIVLLGVGFGWYLYGPRPLDEAAADPLEKFQPDLFTLLRRKYFIDEVYEWAVVGFHAWWARLCDGLDQWLWRGIVQLAAYAVLGCSWLSRALDEFVVNRGFDEGCREFSRGGGFLGWLHDGRAQHYLRGLALAVGLLLLLLMWGCGVS